MTTKTQPPSLDLDAIARVAQTSTPGPIFVNRFDEDDGSVQYQLQTNGNGDIVLGYTLDDDGNARAKQDAELWATARDTILALVQRVQTAERKLASIEREEEIRREDRMAWYPVETPIHERVRDAIYEWGRTATRGTTPFRELGSLQISELVCAVCKLMDKEILAATSKGTPR